MYWKQHKVYLYGQLAFLPEILEAKVLGVAKLRHYFDADNLMTELRDYEQGGYFKVEVLGSDTFKLTDINIQKFRDELDKYLKNYRAGKLTTGGQAKPSFEQQQAKLWGVAAEQYEQHKYRPIIKWQDIYSTSTGYGYTPPFWEVVLTPVLAEQVKLINIGHTKTTADVPAIMLPLYEKPFAEFEITDAELKQAVAPQPTPPALPTALATRNAIEPTTPLVGAPQSITIRSYDANSGILFFSDKEIQIVRQKNRQGKAAGETIQGAAMRKLFKDVNSLRKGVLLRAILSVSVVNFDNQKRKRAKNHLDEINRKIEKETGVPKLITYDQVNYYIDKSYLR